MPLTFDNTGKATFNNSITFSGSNGLLFADSGGSLNTVTGGSGLYLQSTGINTAPTYVPLPTYSPPAASCSFLAAKTSNQVIAANTTAQIVFGTTVSNVGSVYSSNAFTVPTSGKLYMFNIQIYAINASLSDYVKLLVNGTAVAVSQAAIVLTSLGTINISISLILNAGDVVTVSYVNNSILTAATIQGQSSPYNSWFSGYRLT